MPYNPGNKFIGPQVMAGFMDREKQQREKDKSDGDLMKGFKALHQASPELQAMVPIQDFGDMSANAVRGIMEGIGAMHQQQQVQVQQAQAEQQAQAQLQRNQLEYLSQQQEEAHQKDMMRFRREDLALKKSQSEAMPKWLDVPGANQPPAAYSPRTGNVTVFPQPLEERTEPVGTAYPSGAVDLGNRNRFGERVLNFPPAMNQWDYMKSRRPGGAPGAGVTQPQQAAGGPQGSLPSKDAFIEEFKKQPRANGQPPTQAQLDAAYGRYWR